VARSDDRRRARGEEVPEGERSLRQRIQEQTVRSAREFYGDSLGRLENMLQGDRAQLEDLAEQLPEGDAEAQVRDMAGSYSKIEESLRWVARDLGAEDAAGEAVRQAQEEAAEEPEQAARGVRDAAGTAAGLVRQIAEGAQVAVGQVLDRVGQVTENLPGGRLLNRTTDEAGQTVQRAVDESGVIVEITLDEADNLANQRPVGSIAELPAEEEYQNEEGQTIRTVKEESGTLVELRLGEDGSILDLQVLPPSKI
jgi:hypothetical protein